MTPEAVLTSTGMYTHTHTHTYSLRPGCGILFTLHSGYTWIENPAHVTCMSTCCIYHTSKGCFWPFLLITMPQSIYVSSFPFSETRSPHIGQADPELSCRLSLPSARRTGTWHHAGSVSGNCTETLCTARGTPSHRSVGAINTPPMQCRLCLLPEMHRATNKLDFDLFFSGWHICI